jgi:hypothetical protein
MPHPPQGVVRSRHSDEGGPGGSGTNVTGGQDIAVFVNADRVSVNDRHW